VVGNFLVYSLQETANFSVDFYYFKLESVLTETKNVNERHIFGKFVDVQWNLWIAALWNEYILWNKDTSVGPKLLFSVQIALWNEDTSQLGTLLARPKGVLISQVSLYCEI
jgi:hypothetical protein